MRPNSKGRGLILAFAIACFMAINCLGVIQAPERLLPDDTLFVVTAPDFSKLKAIWEKLPQRQLWNDPAMKPFREDFVTKWNDELVKPLERELDIKWADYTSLLQGQLTFALIQNGSQGADAPAPAMLLLLDTKDKSGQLKKNLAAVRKKWAETGKTLKSTKIREFEFTTLQVSSNDIPKTLRKFFPKSSEVHELGEENTAKAAPETEDLVIGQVDSLLVISSTIGAAEKAVSGVTSSGGPRLAELAAYQRDASALFRDVPLYGWLNLKAIIDVLSRKFAEKKDNAEAPNPFDLKPEKILAALGFNGLKSLAFTFQQSNEGSLLQLFVGAPESSRQGLLRILSGESRETLPPPFVPGDIVKFQRWRIDGQKTWETVQKVINDISPQWLSGINFLIETANTAAREKEPGFDIKKNVIGNIGDDMITYEKAPRGKSLADLRSPPTLFLLGSPNAEQLASAFKNILVYTSQQPGGAPEEREFLGRKIYSVSLKSMMMPLGGAGAAGSPKTLNYAASGGYVAFSSDPALVEEYLRSSEGQRATLREARGLTDAAQKVTGSGSSLFGYENQLETTRSMIEELKKNAPQASGGASGAAAGLLPSSLNLPATVKSFKDLMDFSLLPPFESIAKYFHFAVYGGGGNVDGLTYKMFMPVPPGLKGGDAAQH